jgi:hypothetical protein
MNRTAMLLASILMPLLSARAEPAKIPPAKIDLIAAAPGRNVFRIEAGEAAVGGSVIKRVELGKTTAVITYFNKTAQPVFPRHRFRLIDAYGIEIASFYLRLGSEIGAGEGLAQNARFEITNAGELLEFSTVALPADWAVPVYLVIEDDPRPQSVQRPMPMPVPQPPRAINQ